MAQRLASAVVLAAGRLFLNLVGGTEVGDCSSTATTASESLALRLQACARCFLHLTRHAHCVLTRQGPTQTTQGDEMRPRAHPALDAPGPNTSQEEKRRDDITGR